MVGLTVLADKYLKRLHQLSTFPPRCLLHDINTVRQILCLSKAVFITGEYISLGFLCCVIAACGFQINLKGCSCFGCFNLGFSVIGVLDNGDIALDNLLSHIVCGTVALYGIKLWLCADMMNCSIEQIALGRADFSDSPIIITDIIICCKLPVLVRSVGVNQFFAFINAVNCTCKRSVALCRACFRIGFRHGHIELFENVRKAAACNLFPFNRSCLAFGNNIANSRIYFLNGVRRFAAD